MVTVDSRLKWNDTGTNLIQGKQYRYRATGSWQDWYIVCDANGSAHFSNGRTRSQGDPAQCKENVALGKRA